MRLFVYPFLFFILSCSESHPSQKNQSTSISEILLENNLTKDDITLHVIKHDYILHVENADSVLKSYPVVFGTDPDGQKLMEGDRKTPEGKFKLRDLYPHAKWSKFLWIDYPNEQSRQNHSKAKAAGKIPHNATIGGEVGIHGVPEGYDQMISEKQNWTWGCVSLTNEDVNELYQVCKVGTEIFIEP